MENNGNSGVRTAVAITDMETVRALVDHTAACPGVVIGAGISLFMQANGEKV